MKLSTCVTGGALLASLSPSAAFSPGLPGRAILTKSSSNASFSAVGRRSSRLPVSSYQATGLIDVTQSNNQRDVYTMEQWAAQYGMQKAPGVDLYSEDGADWQLVTQAPIAAGSTVIYVPSSIVLGSNNIAMEMGNALAQAESALVAMEQGLAERLPLFRLMVKILAEWDAGADSPYFPWLNSLPKQFYNGVSMTDACFECLPPYASIVSMNERNAYSRFVNAVRKGFVPLNQNTISDDRVVKWAYNVALTRFHEVWEPTRQKFIAPMADMLNHSAEPNCEILFDAEGNCYVQALYDIQPGSLLTVSYGDPTNPTPLFAKYGFLTSDCKTIFCKAIHLDSQIKELGYEYQELLFQYETGEIAPKVWDIFLYELLQTNDPNSAGQFYQACKTNDEATKQQYHDHYFQYTLEALKNHVYSILGDVDQLNMKAQSYDLETHPRVPVILAHNNLVRDTFSRTAVLLDQMG